MSINYILLFSFTIFLASIIPGPSMLLALTHGIQYGSRRTTVSALGNVLVTLLQASISIAGLGKILTTSSTMFMIIKWLGSGYLIFLGLKIFLSRKKNMELNSVEVAITQKSNKKMFIQSVLVTISNPKAILFFTAIFPQFINTEGTFFYQSLILLMIVCLIAFLCFMIYAIGGQKIFSLMTNNKIGKFFDKVLGITFIGAGVSLAATS